MTKLTIIIATVVALLATALSPVHAQEQYAVSLQTTIVNDDPILTDNVGTYNWYEPPADVNSTGYGANGFRYTTAIGRSNTLDSWARWDFDAVDGRYEVQAWIPSRWATAHVQYQIWVDENADSRFSDDERIAGPWLDQQTVGSGWQSLGPYLIRGRVRIEVHDILARDDYRDGRENALIAVDAIRLLRTSSTAPPSTPRSVTAVPHGESSLRVTWSAPADSGSSPISGYEIELSRDGLNNHRLHDDQDPWNSGFLPVNGTSYTTGNLLSGVTYRIRLVTINQDDQRSIPFAITATTSVPSGGPPGVPRWVGATQHGEKGLRVTWSPPSANGGSPISKYEVKYSRDALNDHPVFGDRSEFNSSVSVNGTSNIHTSLLRGVTYRVRVVAINENGWRSEAAGTTATAAGATTRVYIDDTPILTGHSGSLCHVKGSGTKSCWKEFKHRTNTYWYRPSDDQLELNRTKRANDYWGTTGFHVVYIDPEKRNRAAWQFDDVAGGVYQADIYLPDVPEKDHRQPGAIVRYRVEVNDERVLTKLVDQSQYHDIGGRWIALGDLKIPDDAIVEIDVSDYWPGGSESDSYAARPSGSEDWEHHLAADAARLMPTNPDWSSLGTEYDSAVWWCLADVVIKLLLEPFVDILKELAKRVLEDALIAGALVAASVATAGAASPAGAVVIATRVGLSVKQIHTIVQAVEMLQRIFEVIRAVDSVVDNVKTLSSLIDEIGDIVLNPDDELWAITALSDLCERERVWENYFGDRNLWDRLRLVAIELLGDAIDILT